VHLLGKQNVYGSIFRFEGKLLFSARRMVLLPLLYPEPPRQDLFLPARRRVLGVLPGIVGSIQAMKQSSSSLAAVTASLAGCCCSTRLA